MYSQAEIQERAFGYVDVQPPRFARILADRKTVAFDVVREASYVSRRQFASSHGDAPSDWFGGHLGPAFEATVTAPTGWEICDYCGGDGHHARHLGVVDPNDGDRWDHEELTRYFDGVYDMACEICAGTGKIRFPRWAFASHPAAERWHQEMVDSHYDMIAQEIAEYRAGA